MGQHHWRENSAVTVALAPGGRHAARTAASHATPPAAPTATDIPLVPRDAPPAGLGYPAPTAYRRDPVTGVPTPPWGAFVARRRPARTGAPLAVAVAGAAIGLVGVGAQLPGLVDAVTATTASTAPASTAPTNTAPTNTAPAAPTPAVAGQCATVVADALDDTVSRLGGTPSGQWSQVVEAREQSMAATYGDASREQRAYTAGADDILGWLREDAGEDYGAVTTRVAQTVATTCAT